MSTTKSDKRVAMLARIEHHGRQLIEFFGLDPETNPVALCKQLRRIEAQGNALAVKDSNGDLNDLTEAEIDRLYGDLERRTKALLNDAASIEINRDPRGYFLKIANNPLWSGHRDMGGYGIIAPDLSEGA